MAGPEGKQSDLEKNAVDKPKSSVKEQPVNEKVEGLRVEIQKDGEKAVETVEKVGGDKEDKEEVKGEQADAEVEAAEISAMMYGSQEGIKLEFANKLFTTLGGTSVGVGAYSVTTPGEQNKGYGEAFLSVAKGPVEVGAGVGKQGGEIGTQLMFYCTLTTDNKIAITYYGAAGKDSFTHGALVKVPLKDEMSLNTAVYLTHDLGKESGERPSLTNFLATLGLTKGQLTAGAYVSVDPDKLGAGGMIGATF
ncbi:MAG: hypothetical protein NTZ25_05340 [Candidatus Peregrinibacteria bacterium]|nr:hypothetical protein [Candidatus Peregrinibacteria bacterium]